MKTLKTWVLDHKSDRGIQLLVDNRHWLRVEVLEQRLFRVRVLNKQSWRLNRSWTINPDGNTLPEGRSRDSTEGFSCPSFHLHQGADQLILETDDLRLTIAKPLHLNWDVKQAGQWQPLAEDRTTGAYMLGVRSNANAHFMHRKPGERFYGLGEKAGELERTGRRYEMRGLDAMGYDAQTTDPLYKHFPFTITKTVTSGSYSLFYDTLNTCVLNLGQELDNYHKAYRSFSADDGDLDYYFRWSPDILGLVKSQLALTGGMAFPPRWSLGYSGSTMAYTDAPDAQAQLEGFLKRLEREDIPCDSFNLSSGYTSIGDKRYVFNWNREKIPQPTDLTEAYSRAGVKLIANIKPCLLRDHPLYEEAAQKGLFIQDSEFNTPQVSSFWDAEGSHLDFTNPATQSWWQSKVTETLLDYGITSTWNDNNEYEVWDHGARCTGFGEAVDVGLIRPAQTLLMVVASHSAQVTQAPNKRPYLVTRAGCAGLQRYAQTWTGDNRTSWESLRWNIRMGLGLSLSGVYNIGHDVGGFAGPQPGPELLLRWVQNGIFHPRFTIHSWNEDGSVTEPWTHPSVTAGIRAAIRFRYRLLPYLYTCLWQSVQSGEPMLRPTFLDHESDQRTYADCDDFMLGRDLLVASVVEEGAESRTVYLPENGTGWWDFWEGRYHPPGTLVEKPVGLDDMPLFVRAGAILPLADDATRAIPEAETSRSLAVFPAPGHQHSTSFMYDDDGESESGPHCLTELTLTSHADKLELSLNYQGEMAAPFSTLNIVLPEGEQRALVSGESIVTGTGILPTGGRS